MKKKDARILWNRNEKGNISDITVEEFKEKDIFRKIYLYDKYDCDIGNCSPVKWEEHTLVDVLVMFLFVEEFESEFIKDKFLFELLKVDEWKDKIRFDGLDSKWERPEDIMAPGKTTCVQRLDV